MNPPHEPLSVREVAGRCQKIVQEVAKAIVGKDAVLEKILVAFLADGHVLLEDFPGLAKTLIANSFAQTLGMKFKRIQFTPDLLPGDITGGYIFNRAQNEFVLREGPIFSNLVLADEINRASPRTQSALLEAMQEHQVTLEGETMRLPLPFMVVATQNPIEYEGTFPLPEAQLDRFIMKLSIGYPIAKDEQEILHRRRERKADAVELQPVTDAAGFLAMREAIEEVFLDPDVEKYIVDLVGRTRIHRQLAVGSSPRGALALLKLSRAYAATQGRTYVVPDDVKLFARPALQHRVILQPDLWTSPQAVEHILGEIINSVPVPVID
ncbi:MAG TPA: MoxR family ATPase [Anaerolinea sp.]|nr:MoxR family ATPase [Anaerolinea sp.]